MAATVIVQVLVVQWWQIYNKIWPHSALGYRPPAPEGIEILPFLGTSQPGSGGAGFAVNCHRRWYNPQRQVTVFIDESHV